MLEVHLADFNKLDNVGFIPCASPCDQNPDPNKKSLKRKFAAQTLWRQNDFALGLLVIRLSG